MKASKLLLELMEQQFAAVELNLLLDTHPNCQPIIAQYNQVQQKISQLAQEYSQQIEPLANFGCSPAAGEQWRWAKEPWPWEIKY